MPNGLENQEQQSAQQIQNLIAQGTTPEEQAEAQDVLSSPETLTAAQGIAERDPSELSAGQMIALALVGVLPVVAGRALAGADGTLMGAQAGLGGLAQAFTGLGRQAEAREKEQAELRQAQARARQATAGKQQVVNVAGAAFAVERDEEGRAIGLSKLPEVDQRADQISAEDAMRLRALDPQGAPTLRERAEEDLAKTTPPPPPSPALGLQEINVEDPVTGRSEIQPIVALDTSSPQIQWALKQLRNPTGADQRERNSNLQLARQIVDNQIKEQVRLSGELRGFELKKRGKFFEKQLKAVEAARKGEAEAESLLATIERIRTLKGTDPENPNINTGPFAGRIKKGLITFDETRELGVEPDFANLNNILTSNAADFIRQISGLAVTDQERKFLQQALPQVTDDDTRFIQNLDEFERRVLRLRDEKLKAAGLLPTTTIQPVIPGAAPASPEAGTVPLEEGRSPGDQQIQPAAIDVGAQLKAAPLGTVVGGRMKTEQGWVPVTQ